MTKSDERVTEWEDGLPSPDELTPLSQSLIPPELASAFSIIADPSRTPVDVQRASQSTHFSLSNASISSFKTSSSFSAEHELRASPAFAHTGNGGRGASTAEGGGSYIRTGSFGAGADQTVTVYSNPFQAQGISVGGASSPTGQPSSSPCYGNDVKGTDSALFNGVPCISSSYERRPDSSPGLIPAGAATDSVDGTNRKSRKQYDEEHEEADSRSAPENSNEEQAARTLKRPRLVWTPQLHKRFVDAVAHLGVKNAVPKTIMKLMNVEGLTRENVASHLQKYRLYLKRMQGLSNDGPSFSDPLFASTPVPRSLVASAHFLTGHGEDVLPMPFPVPVVPVPISSFGNAQMPGYTNAAGPFHGFDPHAYSALIRTPPPRIFLGDQRELVEDNQSQPGSPSHQILTLFPTSH